MSLCRSDVSVPPVPARDDDGVGDDGGGANGGRDGDQASGHGDQDNGSDRGRAAVLLTTCRSYAHMLDPFLTLWRRYWPACPLPVFVSSDTDLQALAARHGIFTVPRQEDEGFLESWVEALGKVPHEIVLVVQEDFLVERPVADRTMTALIEAMADDPSILCIRTMPWPGPLGPSRVLEGADVELGEIGPHDRWSFSWQAALWRRRELAAFLQHRIAAGNRRVAQHLVEHPELSPRDVTHRAPRPAPDAYAWFNPEWHGHELAELFPGRRMLGVVAKSDGDPEAMLTSPLPYWPTAVVEGELKYRAQALLRREGILVPAEARLESALMAAFRRLRHRGYGLLRTARHFPWRRSVA